MFQDPNTRLVLWGTRHGNRNPENFHMGQPNVWGYEGPVELTSVCLLFTSKHYNQCYSLVRDKDTD